PRISCPAPREGTRVAELLARLGRGETVALVTDAGMPALSDPGGTLVAAAAREGFEVLVVPGPSAVASALSVSGLPAVPHTFLGFLPSRAGARRAFLEGLRGRAETLVWFESPHRLAASLEDAARVLGPRPAAVARELTKLHEETLRGPLDELARTLKARGEGRGEATVVVRGAAPGESADPVVDAESLDAAIREELARGTGTRALARELARITGHRAR